MIFGCLDDFSLIFPGGREICAAQTQKGRAGMARPLPLTPALSPRRGEREEHVVTSASGTGGAFWPSSA